ncbi:AtuA-related protein [Natronorarus salvus]|uniref:AtuA-related protein n=1 Tax=Natronorarus salvus TaxID=3117733 RepID=UPI002F263C49
MRTVRDLAHVRAGDKGNTSNLVVVADSEAAYEELLAGLTADRVHERFAHLGAKEVTRYEHPPTGALNFVVRGVLAGGVTTSLRVDGHGKSLSSLLAGTKLPEESR